MAKTTAPPSHAPTPLRIFAEVAGRQDFRVDLAVDDQHRAGLGRVSRRRRIGEKAGRLGDPATPSPTQKTPFGFRWKLVGAAARVGLVQLPPVLDIEADRR